MENVTTSIKENHFTAFQSQEVQPSNASENASSQKTPNGAELGGCNVSEEVSALQKFYSGSTVFITGGTGFMGKVIVEKLLRSCPDIARIFLLVRPKKGRTPQERIDDLLKSPCFNRVRGLPDGDPASKLTAITGDVGIEGLGLSADDFALLAADVDVVFHFAATVRFDEKLRTAVTHNVRGTRDLLALCRACVKLKAVIHVSTAYSNCPSKTIEERFYPAPVSSELAIQMAEGFDEHAMEKLAPGLVGEWPNTYAYTKLLSEDACRRYGEGLPLAIFRPAIVVCTASEPMSGWIDNLYGPTGAIVGAAAGLLRTMHTDGETDANIVPCDMAVNGVLAAAWDVANSRSTDSLPPVYNYISPSVNRLTWRQFLNFYGEEHLLHPSNKSIWHAFLCFTTNRMSTVVSRLFLHFLPAYFMDCLLLATGGKPRMVATYRKIHKFLEVITYFSTQQWTFVDDNVVGLWGKLGAEDRALFRFNMRDLNWRTYVSDTSIGIRRYLLKEDDSTIGVALKRRTRLQWVHWSTLFLIGLLVAWLLSSAVSLFISKSLTPLGHCDNVSTF